MLPKFTGLAEITKKCSVGEGACCVDAIRNTLLIHAFKDGCHVVADVWNGIVDNAA